MLSTERIQSRNCKYTWCSFSIYWTTLYPTVLTAHVCTGRIQSHNGNIWCSFYILNFVSSLSTYMSCHDTVGYKVVQYYRKNITILNTVAALYPLYRWQHVCCHEDTKPQRYKVCSIYIKSYFIYNLPLQALYRRLSRIHELPLYSWI